MFEKGLMIEYFWNFERLFLTGRAGVKILQCIQYLCELTFMQISTQPFIISTWSLRHCAQDWKIYTFFFFFFCIRLYSLWQEFPAKFGRGILAMVWIVGHECYKSVHRDIGFTVRDESLIIVRGQAEILVSLFSSAYSRLHTESAVLGFVVLLVLFFLEQASLDFSGRSPTIFPRFCPGPPMVVNGSPTNRYLSDTNLFLGASNDFIKEITCDDRVDCQ